MESQVQHLLTRIARLESKDHLLDEAAKRFQFFANAAPAMIWTSGKDQLCVYVNRAWSEFTGKSIDEEVGTHWTDGVHPDDVTRCEQIYRDSFAARKEFKTEYRLRRWDGEYRWILDQGKPWFLPDGSFGGFVGSCLDITDRIQLEQRLRQSQKMEALGQLAAGVAHDFNNILTIIQGHADLVLKESITPTVQCSLGEMISAAERAGNLTRQLLTFSRRQVAVQPQKVQLNEVTRNMIRMLHRLVGENIQLECAFDSNLPLIQADPGMLEQVIMNLAVNSRDAMPQGGRLTLRTSLVEIQRESSIENPEARPGLFASLTIEDTGCGMNATTIARIFEPFFTTKEPGKGTGLGLATVYGIIKMHHGWVEVHSRLNRGTRFQVFLPVASEITENQGDVKTEARSLRGTETVLLVEDEPVLRALVRTILENYGYRVFDAASGRQALELWATHGGDIDLLLTDLMMPGGISGYQLKKRLLQEKPSLKVLCTSGYSPEAPEAQGDGDKENFLQKPYQPEHLALAIRRCIERK